MKTNTELDTKILNKNLEITKLTTQLDNLTSENVDLKVKLNEFKLNPSDTRFEDKPFNNDDNVNLYHLLTEVYERFFPMMEHCERLQPVKLETDNPHTEDQDTYIVNITDEEEMMKTKLFRLVELPEETTVYDDQTSRSILKDLRKVIKSLE